MPYITFDFEDALFYKALLSVQTDSLGKVIVTNIYTYPKDRQFLILSLTLPCKAMLKLKVND